MQGVRKALNIFLVVVVVCLAENVWAASLAMRKPCADCHTMHDSSAGTGYATGYGASGRVGPQEALTRYTCSGCHSGTNAVDSRPYVVSFGSAPVYDKTGTEAGHNTLAGGNFYWVAGVSGDDLKGHNVKGINASQASRLPPGEPGADRYFDDTNPLTCAGVNGCHGDDTVASQTGAIWGAHHGNTTGAVTGGTAAATSYRFLNGIVGYEDPTYERVVSNVLHNQYKGASRASETTAGATEIDFLCAKCHGDFHSGAGNLGVAADGQFGGSWSWLRHPVDIDMAPLAGAGTEYAGYGDGGAGVYNVRTPVASADVSAVLSSVTLGSTSNEAIITCLTCHRAHGSPWNYSLRWEYYTWPSGTANSYNGCGDCHTAKN